MENKSAIVTLSAYGKLTAGDDKYLLLRPHPDLSVEDEYGIPGVKLYGVKFNEFSQEASKPQFIAVGEGFHIDIYLEEWSVPVIVHWKGAEQLPTSIALPVESN